MPNLTKIPLSGSTHGRGVKVAATAIATPTTIHVATATTVAGEGDTIVVDAYNSNTTVEELVLGWGGTTDPDDLKKYKIPAGEYHHIATGFLRNGLTLGAASDTTNKVVIHGYVVKAS